ncbi:hypothetical protein [Nocardia sp. alder85J]|nr:hypothetical protein [Nocardia sp. alder85J]MCX4091576.1 hypothetical protein [Nocardia sp. alder85J]
MSLSQFRAHEAARMRCQMAPIYLCRSLFPQYRAQLCDGITFAAQQLFE